MEESIILDILESIEYRGEIPFKYAYLEKGAHYWVSLSEKRIYDKDFTLSEIVGTKKILTYYLEEIGEKDFYLVDLGPGTGKPALFVAEFLKEKGINISYYIPVDISKELLKISTDLFIRNGYKVYPINWDFERGPIPELNKFSDKPKIMLFLGNTLGNHSNEQRILLNFKDSMKAKDIIILGLYSYNPLFSWNLPEVYKNIYNEKFLGYIPFEVLGIDKNYSKINYVWDKDDKSLIAFLEILKDQSIEILDRNIKLYKGTRIFLGRSTRYTLSRIEKIIKEVRLRVYGLTEVSNNVMTLGLTIKPFS